MPCTLGLSPTSQWGSLPLYVYRNKQSSALGYRTALAQGIAHPDVGSPHLVFPRAVEFQSPLGVFLLNVNRLPAP